MGLIRRRPILLAPAVLVAGAAIAFQPTLTRDLSRDYDRGRIEIGAVRTSLWGAAWAQGDSIILDNVTLTSGQSTHRAKRIEISGATSTRADIDALLDPSSSEPLAARLARITAKRIAIPELVTEGRFGGIRQLTTYRDLVAGDVSKGRIGSLTIGGATTDSDSPRGKSTLAQGRMSIGDLDAVTLARVYLEGSGSRLEPLSKIYGSVTIEDLALSGPEGRVRVARVVGRDFRARPLSDSWQSTFSALASASGADKPSDPDWKRLTASMADILGAFDLGALEFIGVELRSEKERDGVGRIARIAYLGGLPGQTPELRVEGLEATGKDGTARVATMAFTGFSFLPTAEGLKSLANTSVADIDPADLRRLAPTIGTMQFSGLDFDMPNEGDKRPQPERIRFTLKAVEVTADKPVNGVPTNVQVAIRNFAMPIPAGSKDKGFADLAALGYSSIDLSFTSASSWNEPGQEIVIREVSTQMKDVGSVSLRGTVGNVSKDVFSTDSAVAAVSALSATVKSMDLTVENAGVFERYLAQEAKKQGKPPENLRRELATTAAVGIPTLLGNSPQAKAIGQAVALFVAKPGRLVISARAKGPMGIGFTDVVSLGKPSDILDKLEVKATTE